MVNGRRRSPTASARPSILQEQTRPQTEPQDLHYLFAPLKHERLDYMVQKAVEMGVSRLQPVLTHHTQVKRVNVERMRANAIEAAEQCGVLSIPEIAEPMTFARALAARKPDRLLVFCDEAADVKDPVAALADAREAPSAMLPLTMSSAGGGPQPLALLIGPEGGFAEEERAALLKLTNVVRLSLGPRILRADTAAVAALALIQAWLAVAHDPKVGPVFGKIIAMKIIATLAGSIGRSTSASGSVSRQTPATTISAVGTPSASPTRP